MSHQEFQDSDSRAWVHWPVVDPLQKHGAPGDGWAEVVEADTRLTETLRALPSGELEATLTWALADFSSRPVAVRVLSVAHPSLTLSVLPALEPLLLDSHSLLAQCRGLVLRLPSQPRISFLARLTDQVVGTRDSGDKAYRRVAELLRDAGATNPLAVLIDAASASEDDEVREVAADFPESASR